MPQVLLSGSASHVLGRVLLRAWPEFCGEVNGETPLISLRFLLRIKHSEQEKGFEWDNCGASSDIFFSFLSPACLQCWKQKKIKGVEHLSWETWQVRGVFSYLPARRFWKCWCELAAGWLSSGRRGWPRTCRVRMSSLFLHSLSAELRANALLCWFLTCNRAELLPCLGRTAWGEMQ